MFKVRRFASKQVGQRRNFSSLANLIKPAISIDNKQLFINNRFVDSLSQKKIDVIDPRNEQTITSVSEGGSIDIDIAVDAAYEAFHKGPWYYDYTASQRGRLLNKWADLIEQNRDEIATIESWEVGSVLSPSFTVDRGVEIIRYYAGWCDKIEGHTISPDVPGHIAATYREPYGVIGAILPWNVPSLMFVGQSAVSLACGNSIVIKPAETSPLGALKLAQLAEEAGIPPGVINVVPGYGEIAGQALCRNNKMSKISFVGESITGKEIMKTCADNLTPVCLELGGKSPMIIFPDCDMDLAIDLTQKSTFLLSGQACLASTRIYVHESIYDEFVEKTIETTKKRKIGDNLSGDVDQGPQQNKQQFDKVLNYLKIGKEEDGADVLCGGKRLYDDGYFVESTVFGNVTDNMNIAKNEIFGPCMQLLKFNDNVKNMQFDDVLERANNTKYGLASGIITNNTNIINKCRSKLQSGAVWVNTWTFVPPQFPFGGTKQSGFGRIGGSYGIDNFTKVKGFAQAIL